MITVRRPATIATISELRTKSKEILERLKKHYVILERHRTPVAVVVDYQMFEQHEHLLDLAEDYILGTLARERDQETSPKDFVELEEW